MRKKQRDRQGQEPGLGRANEAIADLEHEEEETSASWGLGGIGA